MTLIDPAPLRDMVAEFGEPVVTELTSDALADFQERVAAIGGLADGGDIAGLARAAHSLRSSAGSFGLTALQDLASQTEKAGKAGDGAAASALAGRFPETFRDSWRALHEVFPDLAPPFPAS